MAQTRKAGFAQDLAIVDARVSRRVQTFPESVIREMTRVANLYGAVNLAQGFPDFDPPKEVVNAAKTAFDGPYHQYSITWGAKPFREAIAAKARTLGWKRQLSEHKTPGKS